MKVLVACEESQEVCKAFRARGHEAYSCDLIEPSGGHPEWHILGDALKALTGGQVVTMGLSFAPTVAQRWRNNQNEIDGRQWIENNPLR